MRKFTMFSLIALLVALPAIGYQWLDVATLFGDSSEAYELCWEQTDPGSGIVSIQFRRTRMEDGAQQVSPVYSAADWQTGSGPRTACMIEQKLSLAGHWSYEIKGCNAVACTEWLSSLDSNVGRVAGKPRPWWIYGHTQPDAPVIMQTVWREYTE